MAHPADGDRRRDPESLDPVDAFSTLANETRVAAMRVLWEAERPLSFSETAKRAEIRDTGNFNYHLGKLVDHFVAKTDDERYRLTRAGREAMTAVLTGELTDRPTLDRTEIDHPCPFCGSSMEISFGTDEILRLLCANCSGTYRGESDSGRSTHENPERTITVLYLPPAGLADRSPTEIADVAAQWTFSRMWTTFGGVCPDCLGRTERDVRVCPDHEDGGVCTACESRFAVLAEHRCRRCHRITTGAGAVQLLRDRRVRSFFFDRGYDLATFRLEDWVGPFPYDETVHASDPLDYEVRWTIDDATLTVRTGERLSITDIDRR